MANDQLKDVKTIRRYVLNAASMKRFLLACTKRLLISIAVLLLLIVYGFSYTYIVGPSDFAAACVELIVAWPWALTQVFVVVCIVWFVAGCVRGWRRKRLA